MCCLYVLPQITIGNVFRAMWTLLPSALVDHFDVATQILSRQLWAVRALFSNTIMDLLDVLL